MSQLSNQDLLDKWDAKIPKPKFLPNGDETMWSKVDRLGRARILEQATEGPADLHAREKRLRDGRAAEREKTRQEAEERYWSTMHTSLRDMGLAPQELQALADRQDRPVIEAVNEWVKGPKLFLVLGGPTGTGKTVAGAHLMTHCWDSVKSESYEGRFWKTGWGRFVKAGQLARFSYFDPTDKKYLDRLGFTRFVTLDDLGAEQATDTWKATLLELIDTRARNGHKTIITTNLKRDVLRERYDMRVMRRIADNGDFLAVLEGGSVMRVAA